MQQVGTLYAELSFQVERARLPESDHGDKMRAIPASLEESPSPCWLWVTFGYREGVRRLPYHLLVLVAFLFAGSPAWAASYCHCHKWKQKPDEQALHPCLQEMRLVVEAAKELLAGPGGTGKPRIEPLELEFNGIGSDAHEPFVFPGGIGINIYKTACKPYDAAVTACLLIARDHFGREALEISSEGDWDQGDWADGARLYEKAVGRHATNPMGSGEPFWLLKFLTKRTSGSFLVGLLLLGLLAATYIRRRFRPAK